MTSKSETHKEKDIRPLSLMNEGPSESERKAAKGENGWNEVSLEIQGGPIEAEEEDNSSLLLNKPSRGPKPKFLLSVAGSLVVALLVVVVCLAATIARLSTEINSKRLAGEIAGNGTGLKIPSVQEADAIQGSVFPIKADHSREYCNNQGVLYAGDQACTCFDCFVGATCAEAQSDAECVIQAESGTPLVFEEYWLNNPRAEVRLKATDHLGYLASQSHRLEAAIRAVHAMVGNYATEGKHLVIGMGSSQLIAAAMYSLSDRNSSEPSWVYHPPPYYNSYKDKAGYFASKLFEWAPSDQPLDGRAHRIIEFVTSPNNPDGHILHQTIPGGSLFCTSIAGLWSSLPVYDHAYLWPQYTPISKMASYSGTDIAMFTLSKLTGHAGSRIGWAFVEDADVAQEMTHFVHEDSHYVHDNMARAASILEYVVGTQGEVFNYIYQNMKYRWDRLQSIGSSTQRFTFQDLEAAEYDTWLNMERGPSPAYLWIRCNDRARDVNCHQTLKQAGIIGRPGPSFGSEMEHVRLELLMRSDAFEKMASKLETLAKG